MTINPASKTSPTSLNDRIAASRNKCAQATRPARQGDSFERIGKPGDAKAGALGVTIAPTVTVGGIAAVALAPVAGIVGSVLAFVFSPFLSTSASTAA